MKTLKRMMSAALAVLLLVCLLAVPASAEDGTETESETTETYKIRIQTDLKNHTYEAYQIFSGTLNAETGKLTNIQWGSSVDLGRVKTDFGEDAQTVAGTLTTVDLAKQFAKDIGSYLTTSVANSDVDGKSGYTEKLDGQVSGEKYNGYLITVTEQGYYLIKDKNDTLDGTSDAYTRYMLQVVGDVQISPKSGTAGLTKQVSKTEKANYTMGISSCFGDTVYFKLSASMENNAQIDNYTSYYMQFEDTLPKGLTYEKGKLYVGQGTDLSTYQEINSTDYDVETVATDVSGESKFTVTIKDAQAAVKNKTGKNILIQDNIVFIYSAKVENTTLVNATTGNVNKAKLYYSNNPNEDYDPETGGKPNDLGVTAEAVADVYSYAIELTKVDATTTTKTLPNASFVIYRYTDSSAATKEYLMFDSDGKFAGTTTDDTNSDCVVKTGNDGKVKVSGLCSGTYHFRETVSPSGYNLLTTEVSLTISASIDAGSGALVNFKGQVTNSSLPVTVDTATGTVSFAIANREGSTLPATGGMGTTIFYVVGIVLVAGAATVLFAKKRTERN